MDGEDHELSSGSDHETMGDSTDDFPTGSEFGVHSGNSDDLTRFPPPFHTIIVPRLEALRAAAQNAFGMSKAMEAVASSVAANAAVAELMTKAQHATFVYRIGEQIARAMGQTALPASLSKQFSFPAEAIFTPEALARIQRSNSQMLEAIRRATIPDRGFGSLAARFTLPQFPALDFKALSAVSRRWIPSNLRDVEDLNAVATIATEEGIPLVWVPRAAIVNELLSAADNAARIEILRLRLYDVLDDCEVALSSDDRDAPVRCREAIHALRDDHVSASQSLASNLVDSLIGRLHGGNQKAKTKARKADAVDIVELGWDALSDNLAIRPVKKAMTEWHANSKSALPTAFSRHATTHAADRPGVFSLDRALVAVMLATSLILQYDFEPSPVLAP